MVIEQSKQVTFWSHPSVNENPVSWVRAFLILSLLLLLFHSFIQKTLKSDLTCTRHLGHISELNRKNPSSQELTFHHLMLPLLQHILSQQNSYTSWAQWGVRHCSKICSFHLPPKCIAPSPLWPQQSGYSLHTPAGHYSHSWWHPVSGEWISHHPRHRLHLFGMLPQQWVLQSQCLTCQQPPE